MHLDLTIAKENILKAQQRQEKYANRKRRDADEHEVGDRVMLSTEGMTGKSGKLLSKFIGPFQVIAVPSLLNVKLLLPSQLLSSRTHDVFHISKVKHFITSDREFPGREQVDRPLPEMIIEGEEHFEVESLLAKRQIKKGRKSKIIQYLVKWKGFDMSESSWQTEDDLVNAPEMIHEYEQRVLDIGSEDQTE
jgi:hypothetical protein